MSGLSRALRVRAGEARMVGLTVGFMFLTWTGYAIGQSSVDALFFARYGVEALPVLYLLLAGSLFVATLGLTALLGAVDRTRLFVLMPPALAVLMIGGRLGIASDIRWVYPAMWLLTGLALLVQGLFLWGVAGMVTDSRQARRLFPLFGAGAILGAMVGGLVTKPLASWLHPENLLLLWAGVLLVAALLARACLSIPARRVLGRPAARRRQGTAALRQIRDGFLDALRSGLFRWMSVAAVLFSVLYYSLYLPFSRAAVGRFPDAESLAGFLGLFSGLSTGAALLVSLFVANRLFARFGTPAVILGYTIVYLVGFAFLAVSASFVSLVVVRFVQLISMQGLANSAWEAMINVAPEERRDRARAFMNGGPAQAGTAIAGMVYLVGHALRPAHLFMIGLATAAVAAFAALKARREYVAALVDALRVGRPHVFEAPEEEPFAGAWAEPSAVGLAVAGTADGDPRVRRVSVEVLGRLGSTDGVPALRRTLEDGDPLVRAVSLRSLARLKDPSSLPDIRKRLSDPEPEVRLAAVEAVQAYGPPGPELRPLLDDGVAAVRAHAAGAFLGSGLDAEAVRVLRAMIAIGQPEEGRLAVAALGRGTAPELFELAAGRLDDINPAVRAGAAEAIAALDADRAVQPLVAALEDPDSAVRSSAVAALAGIGSPVLPAVLGALANPGTESAALSVLERIPTEDRAEEIRGYVERAVRRAVAHHDLASAVPVDGDDRRLLLRDSLSHLAREGALNALRAASLLGDRVALREAIENLSEGDPGQRAAALEVFDSTGDASMVRPLLQIWEPGAPSAAPRDWAGELRDHPDPWIRDSARFAAEATLEGGTLARSIATLSVMERVLFLRKVSLFAEFPPGDLKRVAGVAEERLHSRGDTVAAEGDVGDEMHIVVSGEISVITGGREVARRREGDVVGEMAIIAGQPRMASLVAASDARLLAIGQRQFEGILRERPETGLAVMRVLCERLRERESPSTGS